MKRLNSQGALALGSFTAAVALLAGLGSANAQLGSGQTSRPAAPTGVGAGSFPQSFLIPGTNTSLSLYGKVTMSVFDYVGSFHLNDTSPSGGGATPFQIGALSLEGPGAAGGTSVNQLFHSIHGGLRSTVKGTNFAFETRTPSDLGEIKTVVLVDFAMFASQNNYIGAGTAATSNKPGAGAGNNEGARIQWAYGTLGPWLIGQYNTAWADPLLITPDIGGGQAQIGLMQTVNIRRPQIRYTYLAGNGVSLSASMETMATGVQFCTQSATTTCIGQGTLAPAAIGTSGSDNLDVGGAGNGGIVNLPTFNTGIAWDQPWGHLMSRVGVGRSETRNVSSPALFNANNFSNNVTQWHWAVEGGAMINTWGQDQWRGLVNYSHGLATYFSDMPSGTVDMIVNSQTGQVSAITALGLNTSYIHRFNPNWRSTVEFGIGFFNKPDAAKGWSNCSTNTLVGGGAGSSLCAGGTTSAQLASVEKRHLNSAWSLTYSPVPGQIDISIEWDHFERWTQATSTGSHANIYAMGFNFYW